MSKPCDTLPVCPGRETVERVVVGTSTARYRNQSIMWQPGHSATTRLLLGSLYMLTTHKWDIWLALCETEKGLLSQDSSNIGIVGGVVREIFLF